MADLSKGSTIGGTPILSEDNYGIHRHNITEIDGIGNSAYYNRTSDITISSDTIMATSKAMNTVYEVSKISSQIPGGFTNYVLRKKSNADGDVEWFDPAEGLNIVVNAIEEYQTLSGGQLDVYLTKLKTTGIAVYIEGVRLTPVKDYVVHSNTHLRLRKTYPTGSTISLYNNDPYGDVVAKENVLGLAYRPVGEVSAFARTTVPTGWLLCDGRAVSRTQYSDLYAAISTTFGGGNGTTTFNLPDLRGEFIRGYDNGRGVDLNREFGSWQTDDFKSHRHSISPTVVSDSGSSIQGPHNSSDGTGVSNTNYAGGTETRPRNIALLYCIRF